MLQRHTTKLQTLRFSSHTSLFRTFPEQLGTDYTTHVYQPWTNVAKTHHKTSDPEISSHTSLYWTLPEQLSLTHPTFELCRSSSPYYTTHVCQPWAKVGKNFHKTSDPKIFISHIPVLNFAEQLSMLHHTCEPTHPEPTSQDTLQKLQSENVHLTHPCFKLCLNNSEQMTPRMCANPSWTNIPKTHHKTSDPKIFISHIPVLNFAEAALHITPRICANPSWTNVPKHTTNFNPKIFISHIPVLNFAGAALHVTPRMCANPEPMLQRHTTKPQTLRFSSHTSLYWTLPEQLSILHNTCVPTHPEDTPQNLRPQDFHLTHPSFELCRCSSPYYTTHVCQPWTNVAKTHHKTSDPKIFISHIPVLNFAGTALHVTQHMCANPSWTNVPRHTTNFKSENFHLTHPCFELCLNNSEQMTPHMWANPSCTNVPRYNIND